MNLRHDQTHPVWHVCSEAGGLFSSTRVGLLRPRKRLPLPTEIVECASCEGAGWLQ
jgi:hypothetical protein